VRDIKTGIDEANAIISRLDVRTPQVQIESNLIETTPTFSRALGMELNFDYFIHGNQRRPISFDSRFNAGPPYSGDPTSFANTPPTIPVPTLGGRWGSFQNKAGDLRNLNTVIQAAENEGKIKVIARPSVVTLNNVASTIQSLRILRILISSATNVASGTGSAAGSSIATEKISVGIILTVTPQVSSDGFVLMSISVKSSSIAPSATVPPGTAVIPFDELSREAIANVLVRDGETIVIGGIMKDTSATAEAGVPYLKDIPLLGWFFKNIRWQKDFEELVVFITPRIVSGGSENLPTAEQLWREQLKKTEGG
jgi:type IV pilus assembly protein PilQ